MNNILYCSRNTVIWALFAVSTVADYNMQDLVTAHLIKTLSSLSKQHKLTLISHTCIHNISSTAYRGCGTASSNPMELQLMVTWMDYKSEQVASCLVATPWLSAGWLRAVGCGGGHCVDDITAESMWQHRLCPLCPLSAHLAQGLDHSATDWFH